MSIIVTDIDMPVNWFGGSGHIATGPKNRLQEKEGGQIARSVKSRKQKRW